jgi:hypothetical protein
MVAMDLSSAAALAGITGLAGLAASYYISTAEKRRLLNLIPSPPKNHWFFGHAPSLLCDMPHLYMEKVAKVSKLRSPHRSG